MPQQANNLFRSLFEMFNFPLLKFKFGSLHRHVYFCHTYSRKLQVYEISNIHLESFQAPFKTNFVYHEMPFLKWKAITITWNFTISRGRHLKMDLLRDHVLHLPFLKNILPQLGNDLNSALKRSTGIRYFLMNFLLYNFPVAFIEPRGHPT